MKNYRFGIYCARLDYRSLLSAEKRLAAAFLVAVFLLFILLQPCVAQVATFTLTDIGSPGTPGSYSYSSGTYTVSGAGAGIGGASDSFSFASSAVRGNTELTAKVATQSGTGLSNFATAGLMLRALPALEQPDYAKTVNAYVSVSPKNGVNFTSRTVYGASSTTVLGPTLTPSVPVWLRLVASQTSVAGYYSTDGYTWTLVGKATMSLPSTYQSGFAVSSNQSGVLSTATYTNASFLTNVPQRENKMVLWLRSDTGVKLSGAAVMSWQDQSGNGNNAAPISGGEPTAVANSVNGLPVLDFSGSKWLKMDQGFADFTAGSSIFIVTQPISQTGTYRMLWLGTAGTLNNQVAVVQATPSTWRNDIYSGATVKTVTGTGLSTTTYQALEAVYDGGSNANAFVNGSPAGNTSTMLPPANAIRNANNIGCYNNGQASTFYNGKIAEIIVYNRALSDAERQGVETYLTGKYQLASANPLAAPVISPNYAIAATRKTVTITPPPGAVAYYTLNGGASTLYTGPFDVTSTAVISATSVAPGYATSTAATGKIVIDLTYNVVQQPGPTLWFRSDVGLPTTGAVSTWYDMSGNGLDATQSTSTKQPLVVANQVNGLPIVRFDGTSDSLLLPSNGAFSNLAQGASCFIVTKPVSRSGTWAMLWLGVPATTNDQVVLYQTPTTTNWKFQVNNVGTVSQIVATTAMNASAFQVAEYSYNGSNTATLYLDGTQCGQSTSMQTANNLTRVGTLCAYNNGGSSWYGGDIAEVIFYNKALTTDQRQKLEQYLAVRYNIGTLAPPVVSPTQGFLKTGQTVSLSGPPGTKQYYSFTGAPIVGQPDTFEYSSPLQISAPTTLYAISVSASQTSASALNVYNIDDVAASIPQPLCWYRSDSSMSMVVGTTDNVQRWFSLGSSPLNYLDLNHVAPVVIQNAIRGYPSVKFSRANQSSLINLNGPGLIPYGVFAVTKPGILPAGGVGSIYYSKGGAGTEFFLTMSNQSNPDYDVNAYSNYFSLPVTAPNCAAIGQFNLYEGLYDGSSETVYRTGIQQATGSGNVVSYGYFKVGSSGVQPGDYDFYDGEIVELLLYSNLLSTEQRLKIEQYLIRRYGLVSGATPTFSIPGGTTLTAPSQVAIGASPGATIYWSTTGAATTSSNLYTGPITVSYSQTISALAVQNGIKNSASAAYTLDAMKWPAPDPAAASVPKLNLQVPTSAQ